MDLIEIANRALTFILGILIVSFAVASAIRVLVLPRNASDRLARVVFRAMRRVFNLRAKRATTYAERDRIMALYAPVSLLTLLAVWLVIVLFAYQLLFCSLGLRGWQLAF